MTSRPSPLEPAHARAQAGAQSLLPLDRFCIASSALRDWAAAACTATSCRASAISPPSRSEKSVARAARFDSSESPISKYGFHLWAQTTSSGMADSRLEHGNAGGPVLTCSFFPDRRLAGQWAKGSVLILPTAQRIGQPRGRTRSGARSGRSGWRFYHGDLRGGACGGELAATRCRAVYLARLLCGVSARRGRPSPRPGRFDVRPAPGKTRAPSRDRPGHSRAPEPPARDSRPAALPGSLPVPAKSAHIRTDPKPSGFLARRAKVGAIHVNKIDRCL